MFECLNEMGGYKFELKERAYFEEHIFTDEWFAGVGGCGRDQAVELPIRKV